MLPAAEAPFPPGRLNMPEDFQLVMDTSKWDHTVEQFPNVISKALQYVALDVDANVGKEAPKITGRLAGSWMAHILNPMTWVINSNVKYRWWVNDGTKPHEIRPVNAQALHFKVGGDEVFCKVVHHPGTKANPYIQRAVALTEKRIPEFADKAIKAVLG